MRLIAYLGVEIKFDVAPCSYYEPKLLRVVLLPQWVRLQLCKTSYRSDSVGVSISSTPPPLGKLFRVSVFSLSIAPIFHATQTKIARTKTTAAVTPIRQRPSQWTFSFLSIVVGMGEEGRWDIVGFGVGR